MCYSFSAMGDYTRAIAAGQRALALAMASGAADLHIMTQNRLGLVYHAAGDFREAMNLSRRAVASLEGEPVPARFGQLGLPSVTSRYFLAQCLVEMGAFSEGRVVAEEAVQIAEAVEQPYSIIVALNSVGFLYRRQGHLHHAIPLLQRTLALCQEAHIPLWVPPTASTLCAAYALSGRTTEALPLLQQMTEHVAAVRHMALHGLVLAELSEALLLVGCIEDASILAERLLELSHTHPGRGYQAHAFRLLGDIAMHRDSPESTLAAAHYHQALALAEELGMRPLQAHCHRDLGTLYAMTGQREQARTALSTAIETYTSMEMTFWLPETQAALAQVKD
jgi:tetratricopeptide (TPR) repeat protein